MRERATGWIQALTRGGGFLGSRSRSGIISNKKKKCLERELEDGRSAGSRRASDRGSPGRAPRARTSRVTRRASATASAGPASRAPAGSRRHGLPSSPGSEQRLERAAENMASADASAMEDKLQSLPEGLRTKHPGTWRVVDVSDWVKGWGESFVSAALAVKENGIDGDTIKMALEEASLGANAAKSDLQGDVFRAHYPCPSLCVLLCVCVCVPITENCRHIHRFHGHHEGTIVALQQRNDP